MARKTAVLGDPLRAIAYIRVSTDDQALGPEAQRAAIDRWATSQKIAVLESHEDLGVSGGSPLDKRPALLAAIAAIETHGAGVLAVAKRDRLARDVVIAAAVESLALRKGARVLSADGTSASDGPEGMLMRGMVDLFAQYERALIRSRTASALAVKKRRGERTGSVPLGFGVSVDGIRLEIEESEQLAIAATHELRAAGLSMRSIAKELLARGLKPRGKKWHPETVARMLSRKTG